MWALWTSDGEGRRLALLAPGWLHGCFGLNFAFGRRPFCQRMRTVLFGAALLLPVLASACFLAMERDLAVLGANRAWLDAHLCLNRLSIAPMAVRIEEKRNRSSD